MRLFSAGGGRMVAGAVAITLLIGTMAACGSDKHGATGGSGSTGDCAALLSKALSDYFSGSIQTAKTEFQQVTSCDPNNKYGWYNLGVMAQYAGNKKEAAADYQKALALDPKFESVLYNLGVLRYAAGDWNGAASYLRRATAVNDKDASAWWNLGLALANLAKATKNNAINNESTDALNKALRLNPNLLPNRSTTGPSGTSGASGASASGATGGAVTSTTTAG